MAREAAEAAVSASYDCEVADTKTRLVEDVAVVCRDYVSESWGVAMDRADFPADSELKRLENIFFPEDIQKTTNTVSPVGEPLTIQALPPNSEVSKRLGVDKEVQPSAKASLSEDALTIRDVVSKAKDAELKSQADPKDPPPAKT